MFRIQHPYPNKNGKAIQSAHRFLSAPLPLKHTKHEGLVVSLNDPQARYPSLFLIKSLCKDILPRSASKFKFGLPNDFACPSLKNTLSSRTCNMCGLYVASIKSLKIIRRPALPMGKQGNNEITVRNSVRPLRMVVIRYMEMEDLEWHDEQDIIFLGNVPQH